MQHDSRPQGWSPQVTDDDYIRFLRGEPVLGLNDAREPGGPETRATGRRRRREDAPDGPPATRHPTGPADRAPSGHRAPAPPPYRPPAPPPPPPAHPGHSGPAGQRNGSAPASAPAQRNGSGGPAGGPQLPPRGPQLPPRDHEIPSRGPRHGADPFEQYMQQRQIEERPGAHDAQRGDPGAATRSRPTPPAPAPQPYGTGPQAPAGPNHQHGAPGAPSFARQPGPVTTNFGTGPGAPSFLSVPTPAPSTPDAPTGAYGQPGTLPSRDPMGTDQYGPSPAAPAGDSDARRGRHAAPDARLNAAGPTGAPRYPALDVPPPPPARNRGAADSAPPASWDANAPTWNGTAATPVTPTAGPAAPLGNAQLGNAQLGNAQLGPPRLPERTPPQQPQSWETPDWQAGALDQATTMAPYDPEATQLHRAPAAPDLGNPDFEATQLHRAADLDLDATQLHRAPAEPGYGGYDMGATHTHAPVAPDLESPTEMIPPERLGLAPRPADQPGFDVPSGATSLNGGGFGPPGFDGTGFDGTGFGEPGEGDDGLPPRPRRVVQAPRRRKRPRWVRVLAWSGAMLGVLVLAVGGFGLYEYHKINHNIQRVDALAPNDPSIKDAGKQHDAENFLLIGSDTRDGANAKYGADKTGGQRSDTTILAHLSPDRQHATLVSFPRDSWVTIPDCVATNGTTVTEHDAMFNSAFETGGANCTIRTVQRLTGIAINHYVQVDFSGFKAMVDAIGGVPINACGDAYDKDSGLRLHTGMQTLHGEQALSFVRARHNLGDGSDLDRINRQQAFLGAMMRVATSNKIILNPGRLVSFLNAASKSLTLDRQTTLGDLRQLASQLQGLDPKRVSFLTAPIANRDYDPTGQKTVGGGRVLLDAEQGSVLWQSIINDKAVPKNQPKPSAPAKPKPEPVTVSPEQVSVKVLNGVGTDRLASKVAGRLGDIGFTINGTGNTSERPGSSLIRYAPANRSAALTLFAAVPGSVLQADTTLGQSLELVVGRSYSTVQQVTVGQQVTVINMPAITTGGTNNTGGGQQSTGTSKAPPAPNITAGDNKCIQV